VRKLAKLACALRGGETFPAGQSGSKLCELPHSKQRSGLSSAFWLRLGCAMKFVASFSPWLRASVMTQPAIPSTYLAPSRLIRTSFHREAANTQRRLKFVCRATEEIVEAMYRISKESISGSSSHTTRELFSIAPGKMGSLMQRE